jgi:hypothetical protein
VNNLLRVLSTVWTPEDLAVAGSILALVIYLGQRMSWPARAKLAAGIIAAAGLLQWGILAYVSTSTTDTARLLLAPGAMAFDAGSGNGVWNLTEVHPPVHTILGYQVSYPREAGGHLTVWEALALNTAVAKSTLAGLPSVGLTRANAAPPSDPRVLRAVQGLETDSMEGVTFALMILVVAIIGVVLALLIHLLRAIPVGGHAPASDRVLMEHGTLDLTRGLAVGFLIVGFYYLSPPGQRG